MTPEFAKEFLPLITALAEGKTIQHNAGTLLDPDWKDTYRPNFWDTSEAYRVKPEPNVSYVLVYRDGSARVAHQLHLPDSAYRSLESVNKSLGTYKGWAAILKISVFPDTYDTVVEVVKKNDTPS